MPGGPGDGASRASGTGAAAGTTPSGRTGLRRRCRSPTWCRPRPRAIGRVSNPCFYVEVPFDDDRWIRAVQARPDQRLVGALHGPERRRISRGHGASGDRGPADGCGGDWSRHRRSTSSRPTFRPGYGYEAFPAGSGRRLKGGSSTGTSRSPMHYTQVGTSADDRLTFGFWFAPAAPAHEIVKAPITAGVITADGKPVFDGARPRRARRCRRRSTTRRCPATPRGSKSSASRNRSRRR